MTAKQIRRIRECDFQKLRKPPRDRVNSNMRARILTFYQMCKNAKQTRKQTPINITALSQVKKLEAHSSQLSVAMKRMMISMVKKVTQTVSMTKVAVLPGSSSWRWFSGSDSKTTSKALQNKA